MNGKSDCIFCKIVAGTIPASFVYQDDQVCAFMDLHPVNPGHLLVVPRVHSELFTGLSSVQGQVVMAVAHKLLTAMRATDLKCENANLVVNDGRAAGQEVPHFHLHIIPRFLGDGHRLGFSGGGQWTRDQLDHVAQSIKNKIR